ncbi:MAG: hypothetical protein EYC70_13350 [Planctomycetota bacterium]|nr:MAG: hypothetical protein EYC70_13350 [Planctomycetota bacterium]
MSLLSSLILLAAQDPSGAALRRDFSLELAASWERLTDTVYGFEKRYPLVRDLAPAAERARYGAERFAPLLPPPGAAVGDVWRLDIADLLPFLRQLHPGATAEMHHDGGFGLAAPGGWACLRVLDGARAEVLLRVHADFLIDGDGTRTTSSWFTPAQFRGRLVLDRERGEVLAFELGVPAQSANVDVNIAEEGGISADIGRVPRMELRGGEFPDYSPAAAQIEESAAEDLLARKFYPFAEIEWLDLPSALARSKETGKPLHVLALFGSLMDESC